MNLLIVEDDPTMTDVLRAGLEALDYQVTTAETAPDAFDAIDQTRYDLVLLDLELPGGDGLDILRCVRGREAIAATPVIIMTGGRTQPADAVTGLDYGADDYVKKPFEFDELLARIRAVLRRARGGDVLAIKIADLEIDLAARRVVRAGQPVDLTQREFALLEFLARHANRIVSRERIAEQVWGEAARSTTIDNIINVHMSHLRQKVDGDHSLKLIRTARGVGFYVSAEPDPS